MPATAIHADRLSKRYRIGSDAQRHDTFMANMVSMLRRPFDNFRRLSRQSDFANDAETSTDVIWALRDASFEVSQGEIIGLIGRNGAGKSTMLKIIARIVEPTSGRAVVNGRISSLLEVGTGFHPDLTGRENVYFNGVLLGMSKAEMDRKFDEIVDFSGVERFIDTPVKRYSSGMLVRLAFSVAAHLEPEILLVDEVLAVGDAAFQQKCMGKMQEVGQLGRTIVFVSHNLDAIRQLCPRGLLFENGTIAADGPIRDVAQHYLQSLNTRREDGSFRFETTNKELAIDHVVLKNSGGQVTQQFSPGDDLIVEIHYDAREPVEQPYFVMGVVSIRDSCFVANMLLDGHRPQVLHGKGMIACRFKSIPLLPQNYVIKLMVWEKEGKKTLMDYQEVSSFSVHGDLEHYGYRGVLQHSVVPRSTAVVSPYEWTLPDGTVTAVSLTKPRA